MEVNLTKEELEVVSNYLLKKMTRLEESNLTDSYCYPKLANTYYKIKRALDEIN